MIVPQLTVNFFEPTIAGLQAVNADSTSGCYATFRSTNNPVLIRSEDGHAYLWKHESRPVVRCAETGGSKLAAFITGGLVPIAIEKVYRQNVGLIQNYVPNEISEPFEVKKLTDEQISQLLAHMIADWVISNYDNHSRNYLIDTQGRVIGIDKGGSFKYFRGQ